jgi:cation-transporting ATPase 13A2
MRCHRSIPKSGRSTPDRQSIDLTAKRKDSKSKIISKYARFQISEIEEKEETLLPFDYIKDCNVERTEFIIDEYDETCPEYLKIEKIICLTLPFYKNVLFYTINAITLCLFNLILTWFPELYLYIYERCNFSQCQFLGIYGKGRSFAIVKIDEVHLPSIPLSHLKKFHSKTPNEEKIKYFEYKLYKYLYNTEKAKFVPLKCALNSSHKNILNHFKNGLNSKEVEYQYKLFGNCDIDFGIESVMQLLIKELSDPFYLFQFVSTTFWLFHNYMNYAMVIITSTSISLLVSILDTRSNLRTIRQMAKYSCKVLVYRQFHGERKAISIDSTELVPGDVFELPETGLWLPCDCLVLQGTVIVNESMLTGESIPLIKAHIGNGIDGFNKQERKHILYAGTKIIQKRNNPICLVLSTGFNTEKGNLIRSTLFSKNQSIHFKKESIMYIKLMACLSLIGFGITLPFYVGYNLPTEDLIDRVLDVLTTIVPPSLPACIGICISYGVKRIKRKGIICINRERLNRVGRIELVCFDKTGTLTEDVLNISGFKFSSWHQGNFYLDNMITDLGHIQDDTYNHYKNKKLTKTQELKMSYMELLATCHSITKIGENLLGDPIDVQMFEKSNWVLKENNSDEASTLTHTSVIPPQEIDLENKYDPLTNDIENNVLSNHYELFIIKRFDFSSQLQRMTVIVKNNMEDHFKIYCKGAPEKVRDLCNPDTLPINLDDGIKKYTAKGYRVLACAMKKVKMTYLQCQHINRETVESNMIFLGLMIIENKLKPGTRETITVLKDSGLRLIMATGDHIMTAMSVAKESLLIDKDKQIIECEIFQNNLLTKINWNPVGLDQFDDNASNRASDSERDSCASLPIEDNVFRLSDPGCGSLSEFSQQRHFSGNKNNLFFTHIDSLENDTLVQFHEIKNKKDIYLAISGGSFEKIKRLRDRYMEKKDKKLLIYFEIYKHLIENCSLYVRMSPENKGMLIECLQKNIKVCMVGDGANDCVALKAADVGVSLSIEEASIASPFTSNIDNISCLPNLIIEGKATLTTSMQLLKYMMLYSIIQYVSVSILLSTKTYLNDNQYLIADLFIIFPLAFLLSR